MDTIIRRIISPRTTGERTGFGRTTLWRKGRDPADDFPAAVQVSDNKIGWFEDEISAWLESRPRLVNGAKRPERAVVERASLLAEAEG